MQAFCSSFTTVENRTERVFIQSFAANYMLLGRQTASKVGSDKSNLETSVVARS